jgi:peptide/nickel transport system permease protein
MPAAGRRGETRPVKQYIVQRLLVSIPILLGLTIITFTMAHLMPGDFVSAMIPPEATIAKSKEMVENIREQYGLNQPLYLQYLLWMREVARGNLGYSFLSGQPVLKEIVQRLPNTLELTGTALLFGIVVGTTLGIFSAIKQYSWLDQVLTILGFFWISTPGFVFALGGIFLFSLKIHLFPTGGTDTYGEVTGPFSHLQHLILPAMVLGLTEVASFMRYARSSFLDVIHQEYVTVARSKGLGEPMILLRHALRNALIPLITIIGLEAPGVIGGAIIIEAIFAWPGMGTYGLAAVNSRDYPVIMGVNFVLAVAVLLANLITDIGYAVADPRIRYD